MNTLQASGPRPGTASASRGCCGGGMGSSSGATGGGLGRYVPGFLKTRPGMILAALAVVGGGMALGWPTLVAIGVAPLIISLLPCAVMCAMGMCMMGGNKSQSTDAVGNAALGTIDQEGRPAALGVPQNAGYGRVIDMEPEPRVDSRAMAS